MTKKPFSPLFSLPPRWRAPMAALMAVLAVPPAAGAQSLHVSANVALSTDYVFRGVSQTFGDPAISGGFDIDTGSWSAGTWGSSVDFGNGTSMELDLYGGYSKSLANTDFRLGFIAYLYPDSPDPGFPDGQNFVEFNAGASQKLGPATLDVSYAYSPDYFGNTGKAGYLSLDLAVPLNTRVSISAGYATQDYYQKAKGGDPYSDMNGGITFSLGGFDLDVRYHDAFSLAGITGSSRVVASLSRSF